MIKSITYQKPDGTTVEVPLVKECPECGGKGYIYEDTPVMVNPEYSDCLTCSGTGSVPNYITPQQWKEITGEEVPNDWMVYQYVKWIELDNEEGHEHREEYQLRRLGRTDIRYSHKVIIFFNDQPAPPADYIPED